MDPIRFLMDLETKIKAMSPAERAHVGTLLGNIAAMIHDAEPVKSGD